MVVSNRSAQSERSEARKVEQTVVRMEERSIAPLTSDLTESWRRA